MLHILYILAFTLIALLAVSNLIRSLITLSTESQKLYPPNYQSRGNNHSPIVKTKSGMDKTVHPELLDERGKVIEEPLLVMRSLSMEDARQQLDALYEASPSKTKDNEE